MRKLNQEEAVKRLKEKHGNTYNYSLVFYKNNHAKIKIKCNIHGFFEQKYYHHRVGHGCPLCNNKIKGINKSYNYSKIFKEKAILIHGNTYDYSVSKVKNATTLISIKCKKHGIFSITPNKHLNGRGCQKCSIDRMNTHPTGWKLINWELSAKKSKNFDSFKIYIIRCWNNEEEFYKIGRTYQKTKTRFSGKCAMPYSYEILQEIIFNTAKEAFYKESEMKKNNKKHKYMPFIKFNGRHECFSQIVNYSL